MRPSAKFGSRAPGSRSIRGAANAVSGASEPSAVAPATAEPPSTAEVRNRRRSVLGMAWLRSTVDADGGQAGGEAGDRAVRGGRQVDQPVGGACRTAAGPFAAE